MELQVRLFTYGAAGALLTVDKQAVATMRLRGPITPTVMRRAFEDVATYIERRSVQAAVWRVEDAYMVCGIWATLMPPHRPALLQKIPAAMVVRRRDYEEVVENARELGKLGMIRRPFLSYAPALDWARQKGQALCPFPPELPYFLETM